MCSDGSIVATIAGSRQQQFTTTTTTVHTIQYFGFILHRNDDDRTVNSYYIANEKRGPHRHRRLSFRMHTDRYDVVCILDIQMPSMINTYDTIVKVLLSILRASFDDACAHPIHSKRNSAALSSIILCVPLYRGDWRRHFDAKQVDFPIQ